MVEIKLEKLKVDSKANWFRAKVPGGWIVYVKEQHTVGLDQLGLALTFVPDPEHKWS